MYWKVVYLEYFSQWLLLQDEALQDETLAQIGLIARFGPTLGRPMVDTLKGSKLKNLKELRLNYCGAPIRILFAFDPNQQCVVILGGDKSGNKRWNKTNIHIAERLYGKHVTNPEN